MARFKSNSLYLKDNQKIVFGNSDDSSLYFDGIGLRLDTVISGVDPTQAYHLTTKYYVDDLISTTISGIDDHNELNNIQGGNIDDYYHLTLVQHTDLTDGGDSTIHHHDGRYYTETEITTISGDLSTEIDSDISTHESGSSHDARYYTETEVDAAFVTFSGTIDHDTILNYAANEHFTEASIDHGNIAGLGDDDHSIYSLADGTRAFTSTVGGVTPTIDAHLATKGYVDSVSVDKVQSGRVTLSGSDTSRAVGFTTFGDTDYTISVILSTTDNTTPSIYSMVITNKADDGFTAVFSGDIIDNSYTLEWSVRHD